MSYNTNQQDQYSGSAGLTGAQANVRDAGDKSRSVDDSSYGNSGTTGLSGGHHHDSAAQQHSQSTIGSGHEAQRAHVGGGGLDYLRDSGDGVMNSGTHSIRDVGHSHGHGQGQSSVGTGSSTYDRDHVHNATCGHDQSTYGTTSSSRQGGSTFVRDHVHDDKCGHDRSTYGTNSSTYGADHVHDNNCGHDRSSTSTTGAGSAADKLKNAASGDGSREEKKQAAKEAMTGSGTPAGTDKRTHDLDSITTGLQRRDGEGDPAEARNAGLSNEERSLLSGGTGQQSGGYGQRAEGVQPSGGYAGEGRSNVVSHATTGHGAPGYDSVTSGYGNEQGISSNNPGRNNLVGTGFQTETSSNYAGKPVGATGTTADVSSPHAPMRQHSQAAGSHAGQSTHAGQGAHAGQGTEEHLSMGDKIKSALGMGGK